MNRSSLLALPTELVDYILSLIPPPDLQQTTLSLILALGPNNNNISQSLLFKHLYLTRELQSWQCFSRLKRDQNLLQAVKSVRVEAWRDDPQLLVNLLITFPSLRSLSVTVGPLFAPEQLEELLHDADFKRSVQSLAFRFNPFTQERSYYTFLKGAYFDTTPMTISRWTVEQAPNLKRLSFVQDLPPNYGAPPKETPAFGLQNLSISTSETEPLDAQQQVTLFTTSETISKSNPKMDFAQPIVFFKLFCITSLSLSPIAANLTHLILRLPFRNLLVPLTTFPPSSSSTPVSPFPSLIHLDLSTTHFPSQTPRLPLLLLLYPKLQHLVLDRCSGLIGKREVEEITAGIALNWLGKCFGGNGLARSEVCRREWRRRVKDRPTGVAAPGPPGSDEDNDDDGRRNGPRTKTSKRRTGGGGGGFNNMPRSSSTSRSSTSRITTTKTTPKVIWNSSLPPLIKELLILPSLPHSLSLSLGLHSNLSSSTQIVWKENFFAGYNDGLNRACSKVDEALSRWENWIMTGKLEGKRLVGFKDSFGDIARFGGEVEEEETDEELKKFCLEKGLIPISYRIGKELGQMISNKKGEFKLCLTPDCSDKPGVAHVCLSTMGKESREEREKREKLIWAEEEVDRKSWSKDASEHELGCGHLATRERWEMS